MRRRLSDGGGGDDSGDCGLGAVEAGCAHMGPVPMVARPDIAADTDLNEPQRRFWLRTRVVVADALSQWYLQISSQVSLCNEARELWLLALLIFKFTARRLTTVHDVGLARLM